MGSFLTAIKQVFCRESNPQQELNKTTILTEVQKKWFWEADLPDPSKTQGALVFGFQVEGARWDMNSMCVDESLPKAFLLSCASRDLPRCDRVRQDRQDRLHLPSLQDCRL